MTTMRETPITIGLRSAEASQQLFPSQTGCQCVLGYGPRRVPVECPSPAPLTSEILKHALPCLVLPYHLSFLSLCLSLSACLSLLVSRCLSLSLCLSLSRLVSVSLNLSACLCLCLSLAASLCLCSCLRWCGLRVANLPVVKAGKLLLGVG